MEGLEELDVEETVVVIMEDAELEVEELVEVDDWVELEVLEIGLQPIFAGSGYVEPSSGCAMQFLEQAASPEFALVW